MKLAIQNAVVDFRDAEALAGQDSGDVDSLAVHADAATGGDENIPVVERILRMRLTEEGLIFSASATLT
jgi:hypothetical protein